LCVAAWGVARRRHPLWVIGLLPALIIAILIQVMWANSWVYDIFGTGYSKWYVYWLISFGGFIVSCLICWAFDAVGMTVKGSVRPAASGPAWGGEGPARQQFWDQQPPGYRPSDQHRDPSNPHTSRLSQHSADRQYGPPPDTERLHRAGLSAPPAPEGLRRDDRTVPPRPLTRQPLGRVVTLTVDLA
jgi:hypothetical protein